MSGAANETSQIASPPMGERAWEGLSRWGMCWRTAVTCFGVGMAGMTLLSLLSTLALGQGGQFVGPIGLVFTTAPVPIFALLIALFGPALSTRHSTSQAFLFGLMGVVSCGAFFFVLGFIDRASSPCAPASVCDSPLTTAFLMMFFASIPLFIMASVGLGMAIHISGRKALERPTFIMVALFALVFLPLQVFGALQSPLGGSLEEPPGPSCGAFAPDGSHIEVPCGND